MKTFVCRTSQFAVVSLLSLNVTAQSETEAVDTLDAMSVTATRSARATKEVPAAIAVIGQERIEKSPMFNITDALSGTPGVLLNTKNGGYDTRLIIRGSGLKANYGIREVTVLRDGVPITDPDSFTRLDFIDTQDIEQIEVTKGPGNLYAAGSAGGTIQILSKSVFDDDSDSVKVAAGSNGTANLYGRYSWQTSEDQAFALTFSRRQTANGWRRRNEFDSSQVSLKHGLMLDNDAVWESELSYTEANMQIPGSMNESQYQAFLSSGKQTDNNSAFDHSGRYSKVLYINSHLELPMDDYLLRPRIYFNRYSQIHPVTGTIVDTPNNYVLGAELEFEKDHQLVGNDTLVAGVTLRYNNDSDSERYKYADTATIPFGSQAGRMTATLSDNKGGLIETQDTVNTLFGFFAQETLRPTDRWLIDVGLRVDHARFDQTINEMERYDFARGQYVTGAGIIETDRSFTLFAPRVGASYTLTPTTNLFVSLSQADQVPFSNELEDNPDLNAAQVTNLEFGLKQRSQHWQFDGSVYFARGKDEVIQTLVNDETVFQNAGATDKKGLELSLTRSVAPGLKVGMNYAFSDYTYDSFEEVISGQTYDRSGNQLPFVPRHQYSIFADYHAGNGLTARLQTDTWGSYQLDNANSETFGGYDFITNLFVGYEQGIHRFGLNINNLFDEHYAVEVKKDSRGSKSYTAGAPRSILLSYQMKL